jgi:hypothetical protein
MISFRILLVAVFVALISYTVIVVGHHGMGLIPIFFGDIAKVGWPGQFNLDFLLMLIFSGLWVAWRHHFSAGGLALAALAVNGGALFLSVYLLVLTVQEKGDMQALLVGKRRAS